MTIKTFWTIFLKILGIWLILGSLSVLSQFLTAFTFIGNMQEGDSITLFFMMLGLFLTIGAYALVLWIFVFRSEWLINKLKLDEGFEEERIDLDIQLRTVLTIATIVAGGLIVIDALPLLCREIFLSFQNKNDFREDAGSGWIIFYAAKTLLGYLVLTNSRTIIDFINRNIKTQADQDI